MKAEKERALHQCKSLLQERHKTKMSKNRDLQKKRLKCWMKIYCMKTSVSV